MVTETIAARFVSTVDGMKKKGYVLDFSFEVNGFEYRVQKMNRCVRLGMSPGDVLEDVHKK